LSLAGLIKGTSRTGIIGQQGTGSAQAKLLRGCQLQGLEFCPANTVQVADPQRLLQRQALQHADDASVGFFFKKGPFAG